MSNLQMWLIRTVNYDVNRRIKATRCCYIKKRFEKVKEEYKICEEELSREWEGDKQKFITNVKERK